MNKGILIVVSGPSGVGKGTVLKEMLTEHPEIYYSVSATTRAPREGEKNGVEYLFISKKDFERRIAEDKMLEYARHFDNYYGTPGDIIEEKRNAGIDVLLEIDTDGAFQIMEKCPDAVFIFILPPSMQVLRQRLVGRGTEEADVVEKRLHKAEQEVASADRYQYSVVNNDIKVAAKEIYSIIEKHKNI